MDEENELQKAKFVLFFAIVFLISGYLAFTEARYMVFGTTVDASVLRVSRTESAGRRGRQTPQLGVEYQFTDKSGALVIEKDEVGVETKIPDGGIIRVEYLAGVKNMSRIVGTSNAAWPIGGFVVSCLGLVFFVVKLAREANAPIKTSRKRR